MLFLKAVASTGSRELLIEAGREHAPDLGNVQVYALPDIANVDHRRLYFIARQPDCSINFC